mgnify:CR=1 FL=1
MARMIPKDVTHLGEGTTEGEKRIFRILEKYTPDDWICYAGQRLSNDGTPDFVLIGPELGVLILEEKSIPINQVTGFTTETWTVVRQGEEEEETHPLRQARNYALNAARAMQKVARLKDEKGRIKFVYGHGVILTNIRREELINASISFTTPPIETFDKHLLICSNDLPSKSVSAHDFTQNLKDMTNRFDFPKLDDGDIQSIRGSLFPNSRAKTLADELLYRDEIIETLTVEQEQMAKGIGKNDKVPHRKLNGVAGSGKTIILKVRTMEVASQNPDWKILLTFFTRSLKNFMKLNMPPNVEVMTIGQCIYREWQKNKLDNDIFDPHSEEGWERMVSYLIDKEISKGVYDAVCLDEAQDLTSSHAHFLRHILSEENNSAFFCTDIAQNIFRKRPLKWVEHGFKFRGRTSSLNMSTNFRNTKQIFEFALSFLDLNDADSKYYEQFEDSLDHYRNVETKRQGMTPVVKDHTSENDECDAVCKEILRLRKTQNVQPKDIAIIHPNATENFQHKIEQYCLTLESHNIPYYWLSKDKMTKINYGPGNNAVTITTPKSAKGLEWNIVFMPAINRYYGDQSNKVKFVAATRARNFLYPSYNNSN